MKANGLLAALLSATVLGACGVPDSTAQLHTDMPGDGDLAETGSELASNAAKVWFPLDEGNEWVFESATGKTHTIRVDYREGNLMYVTGLREEPTWFGLSAKYTTNFYVWNAESQSWGYHVRFGYRYTPWKYQPTDSVCDTFQGRRLDTGVEVSTPAGAFEDARVIGFDWKTPPNAFCAPRGFRSISFAPNVGPVALVDAYGETLSLVSAKVGSKEYSASSGKLSLKLATDEASYLNKPNTIRCITTPCPSNEVTATATFTMTLSNGTKDAYTFQFPSAQHFDFELVDSEGKVVRAWSDDRSFGQVVTQFTLKGGQTKTFTGEVELKDRHGSQLEGTYTVRGVLRMSNAASGQFPTVEQSITVGTY